MGRGLGVTRAPIELQVSRCSQLRTAAITGRLIPSRDLARATADVFDMRSDIRAIQTRNSGAQTFASRVRFAASFGAPPPSLPFGSSDGPACFEIDTLSVGRESK